MTRSLCLQLGALLVLCGCAAAPPPALQQWPDDVPAGWSFGGASDDGSPLQNWWTRFDDPLLGALVDQALKANTNITQAQGALAQALALRDFAAAGLSPTLDASASAQRNVPGSGPASNAFGARLQAGWAPDLFGQRGSALAAADAAALASGASLGEVQVSVAAELAGAYITLRATQVRQAIAIHSLASQQDTLQIADWRQQAGLVSMLDTEQALTALEQTRAQLPALQTRIEQSRHAIAVLTGVPPAALAAALAASAPVPLADAALAIGIPAATLRQRPDVRAAGWQVEAAAARVRQAAAARLPGVSLSATLGSSALTLGGLGNAASIAASLLAGITLPVFDGGALRAQERAQQAALEQAQSAFRAAVLVALKDVEDTRIALQGDRERLQHLQRAGAAADGAAQLARSRYESGLVDFQSVLETQRTLLGTQDAVATAGADVATDQVLLFKALGGGWRAIEPNTTP
jgi:NodT family efflux transporter outer membrane factor (OMF) lipoprotein